MNWIIIASEMFKNEVNEIEKFFLEKTFKPSVYFITDSSISSVEKFYAEFHNVTHCIFVSDGTVPLNPHLFYATGYLNGAVIPVFVTGLERSPDEKGMLPNFKFFETAKDLISNIEENLPKYIEEEEQKKAHKKLFEKGIPFTPDCFSSYIAKDNEEICTLFYEAGMSVNVTDAAGTPMICVAARSGRKEMIEWLVKRGAEIDAISKDRGYSPVMDAVWKSSLDTVELLMVKLP